MIKIGFVFLHGVGPINIQPHMNRKIYAEVNCNVMNVFNGAVQKTSKTLVIIVEVAIVIKHFNAQKKGPMTRAGTYSIKCNMSASRSAAA